MIKKTKYLFLALVVLFVGMQTSAFAGVRSSWGFSFGFSSGGMCARHTYWQPAPVYYARPCVVHRCCPAPQVIVVPQVQEVREYVPVPVQVPVQKNNCSSISKIFEDGELIELNDGSLWGVSPNGRYTARLWRRGENIAVERSGRYSFPHALRNVQTGETVEAALKQSI